MSQQQSLKRAVLVNCQGRLTYHFDNQSRRRTMFPFTSQFQSFTMDNVYPGSCKVKKRVNNIRAKVVLKGNNLRQGRVIKQEVTKSGARRIAYAYAKVEVRQKQNLQSNLLSSTKWKKNLCNAAVYEKYPQYKKQI